MVVENVDIYSLVPSQINELIEKLKNALEVIKHRKNTIAKIALFEKEKKECPHCHHTNIIKKGFDENKVQRYKCTNCNKRFNDLTGTIFSGSKLSYEQIEIFLQCFDDKVSLRKTAQRMNVNKNTVHLLRLKLMDSLKQIRESIKLSGIVESDEIYKTINLKGTKEEKMPRASKPRKSKGTTTRGISKHKICIASAIDENDNMFMEIAGTGQITSDMVKQALTPKLGDIKMLITDCKSSYESEVKAKGWNLKQIKANGYTDSEGNSLANINSIHSGLTDFLSHFRGVSTKHLQGYLDWYSFDKHLNFCFEEKMQQKELLKNAISNPTNITIDNMYDNHSGIDFYDVYSDYNYVPGPAN